MAQRPRRLQPYASADAYFGAQLRSWRTRAGLSQADLARQVHVSGDLIGKIEKAQRRAHPTLAADLDHALAAGGQLTRCATAIPASTRTRPRTPPPVPGVVPCAEGLTTPRTRPKSLQLLDHAVATLYTGFGERGPGLPPSTRG
jgi:DNA-binding XRE family transcriptional regulator